MKEISVFLAPLVFALVVFPVLYLWDIDMRMWWPLSVLISTFILCLYTGLFFLFERVYTTSFRYRVQFSAVLSIVFMLFVILERAVSESIDWLAINEKRDTLSLFEQIILSDFTMYSILGFFMMFHLVYVLIQRKHGMQEEVAAGLNQSMTWKVILSFFGIAALSGMVMIVWFV